jgi:hypothetical protein
MGDERVRSNALRLGRVWRRSTIFMDASCINYLLAMYMLFRDASTISIFLLRRKTAYSYRYLSTPFAYNGNLSSANLRLRDKIELTISALA